MIRYALHCESGHAFESWFPDGAAYDRQHKRGMIACPHCHSTRVEKQIMAPAVATGKDKPTQSMTMFGERGRELRGMIAALHKHMAETAENVGDRFAEEARKIHYGESDARGIFGEASEEQHKELSEEGIEVARIPWLPRDDA